MRPLILRKLFLKQVSAFRIKWNHFYKNMGIKIAIDCIKARLLPTIQITWVAIRNQKIVVNNVNTNKVVANQNEWDQISSCQFKELYQKAQKNKTFRAREMCTVKKHFYICSLEKTSRLNLIWNKASYNWSTRLWRYHTFLGQYHQWLVEFCP